MRLTAILLFAVTATGLRLAPMVRGPTLAARSAITMGDGPVYVPKDAKGKTPKIPSGPFGGYFEPNEAKAGWVGDRSRSKQIEKYEQGSDFLFFQGPAPKTAIQEDVPNFFSPENVESILEDIKITPLRIGIGLAGAGSAVIVAYSLIAAPGSQSPFKFTDRFYPPAIAKAKVDKVASDQIAAKEKAAKEEAKAKAEKEKVTNAAEAEKAKAAAAKAAAATTAK